MKSDLGHVDLLFVNAGSASFVPFEDMAQREAVYDDMLNNNVKGPYFTVQHFASLMPSGSAVVLTTSIGNVKGMPMISELDPLRRQEKPGRRGRR